MPRVTPLVMQCSAPSWAAEPASETQTRWLVGFWVATRCEEKIGGGQVCLWCIFLAHHASTRNVSAQVSRPSFSRPFF